jgi:hypothetical protein
MKSIEIQGISVKTILSLMYLSLNKHIQSTSSSFDLSQGYFKHYAIIF